MVVFGELYVDVCTVIERWFFFFARGIFTTRDRTPALEAQSPNQWTTGEVPESSVLQTMSCYPLVEDRLN